MMYYKITVFTWLNAVAFITLVPNIGVVIIQNWPPLEAQKRCLHPYFQKGTTQVQLLLKVQHFTKEIWYVHCIVSQTVNKIWYLWQDSFMVCYFMVTENITVDFVLLHKLVPNVLHL